MFNFQLSNWAKACGPAGPVEIPSRSGISRKWCRAYNWIKYMATPEASDSAPFASTDSLNDVRWISIVKTLLWVAASIGIGLLLAVYCN